MRWIREINGTPVRDRPGAVGVAEMVRSTDEAGGWGLGAKVKPVEEGTFSSRQTHGVAKDGRDWGKKHLSTKQTCQKKLPRGAHA